LPTETQLPAARNVLKAMLERRIVRREDVQIVQMWAAPSDRTRPIDEISREMLEQVDESS
jgi:hypothetical protein